jgi:hypothetical protein
VSFLLSVETWALIFTTAIVATITLAIRFIWRRGRKIGDP